MQDVEIYIGETRTLSGTVGFVISDVIEDLSQNFNENRWILNRVIVNTTTGVSGLVTRIYIRHFVADKPIRTIFCWRHLHNTTKP